MLSFPSRSQLTLRDAKALSKIFDVFDSDNMFLKQQIEKSKVLRHSTFNIISMKG